MTVTGGHDGAVTPREEGIPVQDGLFGDEWKHRRETRTPATRDGGTFATAKPSTPLLNAHQQNRTPGSSQVGSAEPSQHRRGSGSSENLDPDDPGDGLSYWRRELARWKLDV